MRSRLAAVALGLTAAIVRAPDAHAQSVGGVGLDQFDPSPAGDKFFAVPSPFAEGDLVPRVVALFDYAHQPLKLRQDTAAAGVVERQAFLHLNASFSVQDRLLVSALLPIALIQSGDSPTSSGQKLVSPSSAQIGDLRLGLRVRMIGDDGDPLQVGVGGNVYLPTAPSQSFAGEGSTRVAPYVAVGGRIVPGVPLVWSASLGALVRSSENPSMLTYGLGLAASVFSDRLRFGPEAYFATPIQSGSFRLTGDLRVPSTHTTNAELLLGVRARLFGGLVVGWAAGPGLSDAIGTPELRFVGSAGWAPEAKREETSAQSNDVDGDGIVNDADACPYAAGPPNADPKKNGCPVLDDDEDGVPNDEDACPNEYGPKSSEAAKNGCPPPPPADVDGDGVPDAEDACPNEKGVPSRIASKNGCPMQVEAEADADGDGVPDASDACPEDKGVATTDKTTNGCPAGVRVEADAIRLVSPIKLAGGKGKPITIDASSEGVLASVRDVLAHHVAWKVVEVRAFADKKALKVLAEKTSKAQAEAVKAWLVAHGIAADRLVAKGGGADASGERIELAVTKK